MTDAPEFKLPDPKTQEKLFPKPVLHVGDRVCCNVDVRDYLQRFAEQYFREHGTWPRLPQLEKGRWLPTVGSAGTITKIRDYSAVDLHRLMSGLELDQIPNIVVDFDDNPFCADSFTRLGTYINSALLELIS